MSDLFSRFEVNREPRWPLLLGLIGGSIVLHLALGATVVFVPMVRDALNIAALAGDINYADRAYRKTSIGEDVQLVEVGPKFRYPDGYFSPDFATSAAVTPTPDPFAPKIISTFTPPKAEVQPSPSPSPSPIPPPSSGGNAVASASPAAVAAEAGGSKPSASPEKDAEDEEILGIHETEFNKRPLKDWLARANVLKEKGVINLEGVVEMTIDARLTEDCKLEDAKVVQKSGDAQMLDLAKELAAAIGDSRMLLFLKDPQKVQQEQKALRCDPMPLRFNVKLDQTDVNATVETEADTPERAAQLTAVYNWALAGGAINKKGRDEEVLFRNTKVTANGKQIIVSFKMPRQGAGEILKKQIETKPAS
jgi:hypothetical protein